MIISNNKFLRVQTTKALSPHLSAASANWADTCMFTLRLYMQGRGGGWESLQIRTESSPGLKIQITLKTLSYYQIDQNTKTLLKHANLTAFSMKPLK